MKKNKLILLKQTEVTINKYYKKYEKFMNIPFEMPQFQIKYKKATRDVFANVIEMDRKFILTVDPFLCKTPFAKFTLYHEFTHIYDSLVMHNLGINESYIYIMFIQNITQVKYKCL